MTRIQAAIFKRAHDVLATLLAPAAAKKAAELIAAQAAPDVIAAVTEACAAPAVKSPRNKPAPSDAESDPSGGVS